MYCPAMYVGFDGINNTCTLIPHKALYETGIHPHVHQLRDIALNSLDFSQVGVWRSQEIHTIIFKVFWYLAAQVHWNRSLYVVLHLSRVGTNAERYMQMQIQSLSVCQTNLNFGQTHIRMWMGLENLKIRSLLEQIKFLSKVWSHLDAHVWMHWQVLARKALDST